MKAWWTAEELALQTLPGLPRSKGGMNRFAAAMAWSGRTGATGKALSRRRHGRGGGFEYHFDVLPFHAREVLVHQGLAPDEARGTPIHDIGGLLALAAEMRALQVASNSQRSPALTALKTAAEDAFDDALKAYRAAREAEA